MTHAVTVVTLLGGDLEIGRVLELLPALSGNGVCLWAVFAFLVLLLCPVGVLVVVARTW